MINNYFTIKTIITEATGDLVGAQISDIFTRERNQLTIIFKNKKSHLGCILSCEPRLNYMYMRESVSRPKRNAYDVLSQAIGKIITDLSLYPSDRQITFNLDTNEKFLIQLFGAHANVFFTDENNIVLDSFLKPKEFIGSSAPPPKENPPLPETFEDFIANISIVDKLLKTAIKQSLILFGSELTSEILIRADLSPEQSTFSITESDKAKLWDAYIEIREELSEPSPRIYYEDHAPIAFGLIRLDQFYGKPERPFSRCSDAVRTFITTYYRQRDIDKDKKNLQTRLTNEYKKAERALRAMDAELQKPSRADLYTHLGNVLMANPIIDTKGKTRVELTDIKNENETITIEVNPQYSVMENAQWYYDRARKARKQRSESERRISTLQRRVEILKSLLKELERIDDTKSLKTFFRNNQKILSDIGIRMSKDKKEEIPFRVFQVAGDFEVWVGKSSANNDLLTVKYAKPNDLWFHARGAGGSHVVLRKHSKTEIVPKEAIEQTASIAAYYSKMKTSKLVPVIVTERKYVRKRKGDPPGTVVVSREKVLMVEAKLPETQV